MRGENHSVNIKGFERFGIKNPYVFLISLLSLLYWVAGNSNFFKYSCTVSQSYMYISMHTIYTRNNMGQKCEGNCDLWVLNEILKITYPESLKKILGAVWELPAK